jgi:hypothetical protein
MSVQVFFIDKPFDVQTPIPMNKVTNLLTELLQNKCSVVQVERYLWRLFFFTDTDTPSSLYIVYLRMSFTPGGIPVARDPSIDITRGNYRQHVVTA